MADDDMKYYLIKFNLLTASLMSIEPFIDPDEAVDAYDEAERARGWGGDVEVVLVGADSEDTVRKTHGHYFGDGAPDVSGYLTLTG